MAIWIPKELENPALSLQVVCVESSYLLAWGDISPSIGSLAQRPSGFGKSHFWPYMQHGYKLRNTPPLHHFVPGLGGLSEEAFTPKDLCLIVDDAVSSGFTLSMVRGWLGMHGYSDAQVWVAAAYHACGPYEVQPLSYFRQELEAVASNSVFRVAVELVMRDDKRVAAAPTQTI